MPIKIIGCPCESEGTRCVSCESYGKLADIKLEIIAAITHQKEMRFGLMPKDSIWYQGNESGLTIALGIIEGYEVKQ